MAVHLPLLACDSPEILVETYGVVLMVGPSLRVESIFRNWDRREPVDSMSANPALVQTSLEKLVQMIEIRSYRREGQSACLPKAHPYDLGCLEVALRNEKSARHDAHGLDHHVHGSLEVHALLPNVHLHVALRLASATNCVNLDLDVSRDLI